MLTEDVFETASCLRRAVERRDARASWLRYTAANRRRATPCICSQRFGIAALR
jgi:hypothetical protein